ncbi:phage antirepressor Ant [Lactobacillus johnsonii]|uniref:Phage antirepressor Ant n=1 Tax=Lactobacillus johnsonii TaxID=33959 RepID=A0A267M860_LACJH|nr:phage antirepressor KilAC domain-containing protein [Lactobacillus johnsonii]PAB55483.1 phage antirepressor Ant [Lactobacillus johnsonii]PAB55774.1 phage antirepressor Ant [Lactobacillus johnsonii]PEG68863.1 phage antirepressor Ant [Lactobacillus johnsonii]
MKDLIPIKVENDQQLLSARDLHKGLGLKRQFTDWVKQNFKDFEENTDFVFTPQSVNMPNGGTKQIKDYFLTIDMAKQLCLMSRTEKGKQYRKYLIEVERKWNDPQEVVKRGYAILQNENTQLKLENKNLTVQLEESNKKASYLDVILGTPDALAITQIAADYGYGAVNFNKLLKQVGIQHKVNGQWILYKVYMGKGYVVSQAFTFKDHYGKDRSKTTTYWTQKGRKLIYDVLKDNDILPLIERDDIA